MTPDPTADELVEMTEMAAEEVRRFGIEPRIALLSHSNFGSSELGSAQKMRDAVRMLHEKRPDLMVEGEMHGDAAISEQVRNHIFPNSRMSGPANLLILPNLDAANIAFNLLKAMAEGLSVGPILLGANQPCHIVTPSVTSRGIVNIAALGVVDAQAISTLV